MNYTEQPVDTNYNVAKFSSDCNTIEFGFWKVAFGVRFRAGYTGKGWTEIDWCCGSDQNNIDNALKAFIAKLKQSKNAEELFEGMPEFSHRKPFHKDPEFMTFLNGLLDNIKDSENEQQ